MTNTPSEAQGQGLAISLTEQWNGLGKELRRRHERDLTASKDSCNESHVATSPETDRSLAHPRTLAMSTPFTAINTRPSTAVHSRDTSSVTSEKSSRSSTRKRECERCKTYSPLDEILLVNCADCHRCFHKACVNARDDLAEDGRWRCRKCTERLSRGEPSTRMPNVHPSQRIKARQLTGLSSTSTPQIQSTVAAADVSIPAINSVTEKRTIEQGQPEVHQQELNRKDSHVSFRTSPKLLSLHQSTTPPTRRHGSPELGENLDPYQTSRSTPLSDVGTSTPLLGTGGTPVVGADQAPSVPVYTPHPDAVPGERSTLSRVILIGMALLEAPGHRLQAQAIHEWIGKHIPGYHKSDKQMHNGVSNALSTRSRGTNPVFEKQDPDGPGKPSWWAIKAGMEHKFKPWDHENKCILGGGDETSMAPQKRKRQTLDQSSGTVTSNITNESSRTADERNRLMIRLKLPRKSDAVTADFEMHDANSDGDDEADPDVSRALSDRRVAGTVSLKGVSVHLSADNPDDQVLERDRSLSPFSSMIFRPPPTQANAARVTSEESRAPKSLDSPEVIDTSEEMNDQPQAIGRLETSDVMTVAATAPLVPDVSLATAKRLSRDVETQTSLLPDTSSGDINTLDGITDAANNDCHASMRDDDYEARVLAGISAKSQNFSVQDLSASFPTSKTSTPIPQSVINARPTKKQRMRMPGNEHVSRLGHNTAVDRYKAICEHLGRKGGGDGSETDQGNEYGVADVDFENSQPTQCESLEELVEMPESVVPMLYDQQLVFTDGAKNKNARGRAGRAKNIYRIGANVLHR
ncbi:hypothetical protein BDZ85DRAFT_261682 [Elsinoe ampelina]|uniref:PHD-type domain-containing protein n=1 Tax=Elsinoe ampelina TaxID=302913 RepID=A0A6A6GCP8_9PEZI|nr:hypothetical protein BDZ85DRAFT_261682 [Elsinoe ampelina]